MVLSSCPRAGHVCRGITPLATTVSHIKAIAGLRQATNTSSRRSSSATSRATPPSSNSNGSSSSPPPPVSLAPRTYSDAELQATSAAESLLQQLKSAASPSRVPVVEEGAAALTNPSGGVGGSSLDLDRTAFLEQVERSVSPLVGVVKLLQGSRKRADAANAELQARLQQEAEEREALTLQVAELGTQALAASRQVEVAAAELKALQDERSQLRSRSELLGTTLTMMEAKTAKMQAEMQAAEAARDAVTRLRDILLSERDGWTVRLLEAEGRATAAAEAAGYASAAATAAGAAETELARLQQQLDLAAADAKSTGDVLQRNAEVLEQVRALQLDNTRLAGERNQAIVAAAGAALADATAPAMDDRQLLAERARGDSAEAAQGLLQTQVQQLQASLTAERAEAQRREAELAGQLAAAVASAASAAPLGAQLAATERALADAKELLLKRAIVLSDSRRGRPSGAVGFTNTNRYYAPEGVLFDLMKALAQRESVLLAADGCLGMSVRQTGPDTITVSSMWTSTPEFEAFNKGFQARRSHLPAGVMQYTPRKGEGYPEDFIPFRMEPATPPVGGAAAQ